jgi:hypothetical protein
VAGDDPVILANVALALAGFGEDIGAMMALVDRALTLNPSFARGWSISGTLRNWAGQPDKAIEHVETSLRLSPPRPHCDVARGTGRRSFRQPALRRGRAETAPGNPGGSELSAAVSLSRRVLCAYGPARRGARGCRPAARHYVGRNTGRQLPAEH